MKLSVVFEYIDKASHAIQQTESRFKKFQKTISFTQSCLWKYNQTAELLERSGEVMGRLMQPGVEFEQSMANLSSITGIAGKDLGRLGEIARKTGVSSGLGASGAADAFALLASQIDVSKIGIEGLIELQSKTITLAHASGMGMTLAANAMAGTINQFGLQANQAGRVINVLAAGSKYGAAEIPQLAESFKVVGAAANAAGLSVESTAGAIEVLSKNNLKGAEAGTALRNIVLKMQTAMGVDFSKTSLQEALIKLKPHLKDATYMSKLFGMENVAAAQFLVANTDLLGEMTDRVTGTNVAQEQAAIRTNTWSQRLKEQTARFNDWMITAQKDFGGVMNAFQLAGQSLNIFLSLAPIGKLLTGIGLGAWNAGLGVIKFGRTVKMLALAKHTGSAFAFARAVASCGSMGRIAAGVLSGYQKAVAFCSLALKRATWSQVGHSVAVKAAALWTGICTKANVVASGVMSAWNTVTAAATWTELRKATVTKLHTLWTLMSSKAMLIAGSVTAGWTKVTKVAAFVQGILTKALSVARAVMMTGVLPALGGVIAATWAWTVALLANPIVLIVMAIIALIAAIVLCWKKFAAFRAVIYTIWDTIKGFGKALVDFLVTPFKVVWRVVSGLGKAIYKLFTGDFKGAGEELANAFKGGFDEAAEGLKKSVDGVKKTATGISGNYEMHLTEERAKQAEKEKKNGAPEMFAVSGETAEVPVAEPEKMPADSRPEVPVVNVEHTDAPTLPEMPAVESVQYTEEPVVNTFTREPGVVQVIGAETVPEDSNLEMPVVGAESVREPLMPEVKTVAPAVDFSGLSPIESQSSSGNNLTNNYGQSANNSNTENQVAKVEINFQPNISISAELTQKSKDDFLSILRGFGDEITKMVEEVQRRNGRGAYAIS